MEREAKKVPGTLLTRYPVDSNQFAIEASSACASISFMAAYLMTFCDTSKAAIQMDWEADVLGIGKLLWDGWKVKPRKDTRQSLSDILTISGMDRFLTRMGARTEVCGPVFTMSGDNYSDRVSFLTTPEMTSDIIMNTIMVRLGDALNKMQTIAGKDGHATAMIFHGSITISAYAHRGEFVVYDSHGTGSPKGTSSLFFCRSVPQTKGLIRTIFSSAVTDVGAENYYIMCIFDSPSYQKEEW